MSSNLPINSNEQEIDLGKIAKKINRGFENFLSWIFSGILFFKRNFLLILGLIVVGYFFGSMLDKNIKSYDNQIIVSPNFGSTDYVYSKIELLQSKINEGDTMFLKEIGIGDVEKFKRIKIEPIIDVYKFINNKTENFELIKLFAEKGSVDKIVEDKLTSKNYPFHLISFTTSKVTTEEKTIKPFLNYLNDSYHFKEIQKEFINNINIKMKANDSIIKQIDGLMNQFAKVSESSHSEKLVYYNENTQLNEIIKTKELLVREQGQLRLDLVNLNKVVKESSIIINDKNTKGFAGKLKLIFPLFLLFILMFLRSFKIFYRKQLNKIQQ